jgi:putative aminopeptidase FrvX
MELKERIKTLCSAPGIAGYEYGASAAALQMLREFAPDAEMDAFYNVTGVVRPPKDGEPMILLDAHIDEIGMIVTHIDSNGFLKVSSCGGVDRRLVLGQEVVVYGKKELSGVIAATPPHLSSSSDEMKTPEVESVLIDIGMNREQARSVVSLGDRVSIRSCFQTLCGTRITSKALDDRCGVAIILEVLQRIQNMPLSCGLSILFSSQEETGEKGAQIAGYRMKPDIAVALDVSFAHTPDADEYKCGKMGNGVMIGIAPTLDQQIYQDFVRIAEDKKIPYQTEVMGRTTGTNADNLGLLRGGVRTGLLSIPLKYMHTPVEVIDLADCESVAALLSEYLLQFGREA